MSDNFFYKVTGFHNRAPFTEGGFTKDTADSYAALLRRKPGYRCIVVTPTREARPIQPLSGAGAYGAADTVRA